jgi:hypothetical protein
MNITAVSPKIIAILSATALCLLVGCQSEPLSIDTSGKAEMIGGTKMYPLKNANADIALADPDADFKKYKTVYLEPLNFSKLKIIQPNASNFSKPFVLEEKARRDISSKYTKIMSEQLSKDNGYRIVDKPEADTLIIASYLTELRPKATNEENREPSVRSKIYSEGSGSMTIAALFRDGENKNIIASIEDKKKAPEIWGQNTYISNIRDVNLIFISWGSALRSRLDELHGKK